MTASYRQGQQSLQDSWDSCEHTIDTIWTIFESTLIDHLRTEGISAHVASGSPASLDALGDIQRHWQEPSSRSKGGYRDTADRVAHLAVAWIVSLARQEGTRKVMRKLHVHRSIICDSLNLLGKDFDAAIAQPASHVHLWKKALADFKSRTQAKAFRLWRSKLFTHNASPTAALYRWIRRVPPPVHLVLTSEDGLCLGPDQFFRRAREFWGEIWDSDRQGYREAIQEMQDLLRTAPPLVQDASRLKAVAQVMKAEAAPGLDNWPPSILSKLPQPAYQLLIVIYDFIEATGMWPTKWTMVRTHLVPKSTDPEKPVSDFRPLAVLSVWYRLWSSYRVAQLSPDIFTNLDPQLRGGLPGRTIGEMVSTPLLALEATCNNAATPEGPLQTHLANLDAAKCFDYTSRSGALRSARDRGLPHRLLGVLIAFWTRTARFLSAGGHVDKTPLRTYNGIPQGCPISALICNCIVHEWLQAVFHPRCIAFSFLDDRQILAPSHHLLLEVWQKSEEWASEQKWRLNVTKSHHVQVPRTQDSIQSGQEPLPKVDNTQVLGVDVPTRPNVALSRQRQRLRTAKESTQRIAILSLPVGVKQQLIESIVIPQFVHHLHPRPLAAKDLGHLQSAIRQAVFGKLRGHSAELIAVFLRKTHRNHPLSAAMYRHILTLCETLKLERHGYGFWQMLQDIPLRPVPRGPWATTLVYFQKLDITHQEQERQLLHPLHGACSWLTRPVKELQHFLRQCIRTALLKAVERRRPALRGVSQADIAVSTLRYRNPKTPHKDTLSGILCDGLIRDSVCRACNREPESLQHTWLRCPAWQHLRCLPKAILEEWSTLPLFAQQCLICPWMSVRDSGRLGPLYRISVLLSGGPVW